MQPRTGRDGFLLNRTPTVGTEVPADKGLGAVRTSGLHPRPRAGAHVAAARILDGVGKGFAITGVVLIVLSALAFLFVDPIIGAFLGILGLTAVVIAWLARDWDQHPSFEERERARARKREAKRERTAGARARDRERWEAHQAKKARRAAGQ